MWWVSPLKRGDPEYCAIRRGSELFRVFRPCGNGCTATVAGMEFDGKALRFILQDTKYTFSVDKGVYLIGDRMDEGLRQQRLVQLHNRSAVDSLVAVIPMELRQGVEIKEFKELNGVLLTGSGPQVDEIERFLRQIDKVVPMIYAWK